MAEAVLPNIELKADGDRRSWYAIYRNGIRVRDIRCDEAAMARIEIKGDTDRAGWYAIYRNGVKIHIAPDADLALFWLESHPKTILADQSPGGRRVGYFLGGITISTLAWMAMAAFYLMHPR